MEKRKEIKFEPEKQIDFVKLIESLDWTKEISPVMLVKTVNFVTGLSGRRKYETNEASYGALIKSFEKRVSQFVDTRFHGKDRFYTIKPGVKREQIIHFAKTGKLLEIKEDLKREKPKYFAPTPIELGESKKKVEGRGIKRSFPDNEALTKTVLIMGLLVKGKGKLDTAEFSKARNEFGWRRQRSIEGKLCTNFQEANKVTSWLELGELFEVSTAQIGLKEPEKNLSLIESKINDVAVLIDNAEMKEKALTLIKPEEKPKPKLKPTTEIKPKIFKASPEVGKSEFKEIGPAPSTFYEGSKVRWYKSLIAQTLKGAERGTRYSYSDISQNIKKTRFVEIGTREIKDIMGEIGRQWKGIFREVDFGGITIGSETMIKELIDTYQGEKITETIFVRLKMGLDEIQECYPELLVKLASEIGEEDNVYEIETNRSEKAEKAFAKLVFRMRQSEVILESPSNWTVKRAKILIDKLQNFE